MARPGDHDDPTGDGVTGSAPGHGGEDPPTAGAPSADGGPSRPRLVAAPLGAHDTTDALERFVAEATVAEAVAARRRRWWAGRQLAESTTLAGVLDALAERGDDAVLHTTTGIHRGRVRRLGADHVALDVDGATLLVGLAAVTAVVIPDGAAPLAAGDHGDHLRADAVRPDLVEVLSWLVADRPWVHVHSAGAPMAGRLEAVGRDLARLAGGEDGRRGLYVALRADVVLLVTGAGGRP